MDIFQGGKTIKIAKNIKFWLYKITQISKITKLFINSPILVIISNLLKKTGINFGKLENFTLLCDC